MKLSRGVLFNGERLECDLERGVMKMAKLRKMLTHLRKGESGQGALAIVLMLLMLGAIILTPLLVFMSTGLKAGGVYESKLQEFYSADSGVEDALYWLPSLRQNEGTDGPYTSWVRNEDYRINNREVGVTIGNQSGGSYLITSTATSDDGGNTTVECYVLNIGGFLNLFDNAITSNGNVTIQPNNNIIGNVTANGTVENKGGYINGTVSENATINWPSEEQLSAWYWDDVKDLTPYSEDYIDIATAPIIGPLYRDGTLDISNSGSAGKNATLNGTVYVTGDLNIATTENNFILDLNNQTIYCEGNIVVGPHKPIIVGSGCIIAIGNIKFQPGGNVGSPDDFVFIMSIEGTVTLQPGGSFYGAVAGDADIILQPGNTLTLIDPGEGEINFPTEGELKVISYTIK